MSKFRATASVLPALLLGFTVLTPPATASDYADRLDAALFRAGESADVTKAKEIVTEYRKHHGTSLSPDYLDTADACYAAGPAEVTVKERRRILAHENIQEFYAPNDNMRMAEGFANGWGVKKDLKRATAFACRANTVPAALISQVRQLKRNKFTPRSPFLYCFNVTDDDAIGKCAVYTETRVETRRKAKFMILTWDFDAAEKAAFQQLRSAAETYFDATAKYEIGEDLGRPRKLAYIQLIDAKRQHFIALLDTVVHGRFPPEKMGGNHPKYMDKKLNRIYRDIARNYEWKDPLDHPGTLTKEGLLRSERAWIKYKEAWLGFLRLRMPTDTPEKEMTAYLTEDRIFVLRKMYQGD